MFSCACHPRDAFARISRNNGLPKPSIFSGTRPEHCVAVNPECKAFCRHSLGLFHRAHRIQVVCLLSSKTWKIQAVNSRLFERSVIPSTGIMIVKLLLRCSNRLFVIVFKTSYQEPFRVDNWHQSGKMRSSLSFLLLILLDIRLVEIGLCCIHRWMLTSYLYDEQTIDYHAKYASFPTD